MFNALTDIAGIKVGHYTNTEAATGCTVILCEEGATAGVDLRGSAPGTRETDLLRPMNLVQQVQAILLSGGSAFGLDAASGVMHYLEQRGHGFEMGVARVPIVPAAILFDLYLGNAAVRPGAEEGYEACLSASSKEVNEGSVGAGTGATVGKILGMERATKSGLGTASCQLREGISLAALVVVNALGDVVHPETGEIIAGPRRPEGKGFFSTPELLKIAPPAESMTSNTTLGVIATDASLNKEQVNRLAQMAQDGLARVIRPCHTMFDGDVLFALSRGTKPGDITMLGSAAAELVAAAVLRAVGQAEALAGIPPAREVI